VNVMSDEEINEPPHKVGDVIEKKGVRRQVTEVRRGAGGIWIEESSAEPLAEEKGYLTLNQAHGFRVEHYLPPSPPEAGVARDPKKLTAADWNFKALLKESLEVRKLALVHELARECAAVREACRIYIEGLPEANEWAEKEKEANVVQAIAEDEVRGLLNRLKELKKGSGRKTEKEVKKLEKQVDAARERAGLADYQATLIAVTSGNGKARQAWKRAAAWLRTLLKRLPIGVDFELDWIANDLPWSLVPADERTKFVSQVGEAKKARREEEMRMSRRYKDMEADGPEWPFNDPIEFAREWDEDTGLPKYSFNDGRSGRMILAERHDYSHRLPILSEALELCVCLNFSDAEILEAFAGWLKWRRANLHDDLKAFRAAGGSALRMKGDRVDKALKALSALRLRAKFNELEAADEFRVVYPAERAWSGQGNLVPMSQVWDLAKDAEAIGLEFLPECKLDSAVKRNH